MNPVNMGAMRHRQKGLGVVELMVGVVIALFASLAIFQTFALNESQRRTTGSGSEGLQSATLGLAAIKTMVEDAGYNMVTPTDSTMSLPNRLVIPGQAAAIINANPVSPEFLMGCTTQAGMRMAPVLVTSGGGALASDTITVMQGSSANSPMPSRLVAAAALGVTDLTVTTTYGYAVGDWVLVYEQDAALNAGNARPIACTYARIVALPSAPTIANAVVRLSVPTAAAYGAQARVANLGPNPEAWQISVVNNRLQAVDLINNLPVQVLAENVVAMKVQVGLDVSNDDLIDEWMNPPAAANTWLNPNSVATIPSIPALPVAAGARSLNQMKALRVGLLLRAPVLERATGAGGACEVTPAGPYAVLEAIAGNAAQRIPDMPTSGAYTLAGDDRCFRYSTVNSVIPLRNVIMSQL